MGLKTKVTITGGINEKERTVTIQTKGALTMILLVIAWVANHVLVPATALATNAITVSQMDNTNASTLAVETIGSGDGFIRTAIGVLLIVGLVFIWTRKGTTPKE